MPHEVDLSPEAVERMANEILVAGPYGYNRYGAAAATLVALSTSLKQAEARAAALEQAARALVEALPKCDECAEPATRAFQRGGARWCDEHGLRWIVGYKEPTLAPEYPRAVPLRALDALLGKGAL